MKKLFIVLAVALFLASPVFADSIYIWTDGKGVKRFSDHPPEGIENYEKIEENESETPPDEPDEQMRPGLQKILNEIKAEDKANEQRRASEAASQKEAQEREAQSAKEAKNKPERDRLQKQIDALNNRALSPTFTQGMRENQIKEIQKKIDALDQ